MSKMMKTRLEEYGVAGLAKVDYEAIQRLVNDAMQVARNEGLRDAACFGETVDSVFVFEVVETKVWQCVSTGKDALAAQEALLDQDSEYFEDRQPIDTTLTARLLSKEG